MAWLDLCPSGIEQLTFFSAWADEALRCWWAGLGGLPMATCLRVLGWQTFHVGALLWFQLGAACSFGSCYQGWGLGYR